MIPRFDPSVYVVTSVSPAAGRDDVYVAEAALRGGATVIQLRSPELDREEILAVARHLVRLTHEGGATFIVNDRIDVAVDVGADGVHLGQSDSPGSARAHLGSEAILGVSVATPRQAQEAEVFGADYVGVTVWASPTKPEARAVGLMGLRDIVTATTVPVVGIGGVNPSNAGDVIRSGAAGVAVVSAVGAAEDPVEATHALVEAVEKARRRA